MADDVDFVLFQQEGASPHYSTKVREWLDEKFVDGTGRTHTMASKKPRPVTSGLLAMGYLKNKVYSHSVATLQELRDAIEDELQVLPAVTVHNATLSVVEDAKKLISINELQLGRYFINFTSMYVYFYLTVKKIFSKMTKTSRIHTQSTCKIKIHRVGRQARTAVRYCNKVQYNTCKLHTVTRLGTKTS